MVRSVAWVFVACGLFGCDQKVAGGRADGPAVFAAACARCHGEGGKPDASMVAQLGVKDLNAPHVQEAMSDADIARQVRDGSPNRRMPSFAGALSDAQIAAVVAHVRSLGGDATTAPATTAPAR
jgi:mono/diheme cytochrome c family protein